MKRLIALCVLTAALCLPVAAGFPAYAIIDLGTASGTSSWVTGISRNGHVSADYLTDSGTGTFVWYDNSVKDLGSPFGSSPVSSSSKGVSDRGWVIGQGFVSNSILHSFIYRDGIATDLGAGWSTPSGINEAGYVVGLMRVGDGPDESAFVWTDGQISQFGFQTRAHTLPAINDRGQMAVDSELYLPYPAYGLQAGTLIGFGALIDQPTFVRARAINSIGHIVGEANVGAPGLQAFIWRATQNGEDWQYTLEPLGALSGQPESSAVGVNSSDQVVGWSGSNSGYTPFFWQPGDGMVNINSLITSFGDIQGVTDVVGISDQGYVAATGNDGLGKQHALLLVPHTGPANVSLAPDNGALAIDTKLTFTAVYSDPKGWANLSNCYFLINTTDSPLKAAYFRYDVKTNRLFTASDGADSWMGGYAPGTAGRTIANGYGRLYCENTTVSKSGNNLTVKWTIVLKSPYSSRPNCNGYLRLTNLDGVQAGWDKLGTYIVGP